MQEYRYTYQEWLKGEIAPTNLDELLYAGALDDSDYIIIQEDQEEAHIENVKRQFDWKVAFFLDEYDSSLLKQDLIDNEIAKAIEVINNYKTHYPSIYEDVLRGNDGRYTLSVQDVWLIHNHYEGVLPNKGSYLELIIYIKFKEWLIWLKKRDFKENAFPEFDLDRSKDKAYYILDDSSLSPDATDIEPTVTEQTESYPSLISRPAIRAKDLKQMPDMCVSKDEFLKTIDSVKHSIVEVIKDTQKQGLYFERIDRFYKQSVETAFQTSNTISSNEAAILGLQLSEIMASLGWQNDYSQYLQVEEVSKSEENRKSPAKKGSTTNALSSRKGNKKTCVSWKSLFKVPERADIVLKNLYEEEFISDNHVWLYYPKQATMIALHLALKKKGDLKGVSFSAFQLSEAYNKQFKQKFGDKKWQPNEQKDAEQYVELFKLV